jgi:two-component system sensor kinase FixL
VERKLGAFESITEQRHRARPTSASGTEIDQAYDAVFDELIALTDEVERELYRAIRRDTRSLRRAQSGVIAGVLVLAILVAVIFSRYMRQRGQTERTLQSKIRAEAEAREHLERLSHVVRLSTMSEFAAGIAHEVNQPLAAIAAAAGACRRLPGVRQRAGLELIESEALRASDVIRRMRAFVAKRESHYELVDVNGVVRRTIKLADLDPQMHRTNIRLKLAPDLPAAEADEIQIQQVLLNLVRNGCEASHGVDSGGEGVTVQTRIGDDSNIEVSVRDHGAGVPDEIANDPFRPFVTTKDTGMGMGLSISKSIIDAHGGRIWFCRNEQVNGTTFRFTLPASGKDVP